MKKVDAIITRMYNTGSVGDCLFLQFLKEEAVSFSMLIDCGGYHTDSGLISACVTDIKAKLKGAPLDLVVVTHEHLDHVSGFNQAKTIYDSIPFERVWMAWTEDQADPLARKLKRQLGKKIAAIRRLTAKNLSNAKKSSAGDSAVTSLKKRNKYYQKSLSDTLEALEFEAGVMFGKGAGTGLTVSNAMNYVKEKCSAGAKKKMFKKPGQVIDDLDGAEGIRFFVLGPPYDEDLQGIRKKLAKDEMYSMSKGLAMLESRSFFSAADAFTSSSHPGSCSPFSSKYIAGKKEEGEFYKLYNSKDYRWRNIELDWAASAGELAIAINSYTNNTSLALAIELEESGKVLLFPGDAQSGNWMSWHNPKVIADLKANGGRDTDELLASTELYKVGHHGSHNGTASKSGLDKMTGKKLVALMPLVQDKVPAGWGGKKNFPAKALYTELINRTNGAVLRADEGLITDKRAKNKRDKFLPAALRTRLAKSSHGLYQEWTVES